MIKEMKQKGMYITDIANELECNRKTDRKWLNKDELPVYKRKQRPSKLDPLRIIFASEWMKVALIRW